MNEVSLSILNPFTDVSVVWFLSSCTNFVTFKSVDETSVCYHSLKAIEQYFHMVLFIMLCKAVAAF